MILMCGMWFALRYTRLGLVARGAMQGREVVSALGYNPNTIYMLTFTVGAALSGLAGGVMAPLTGLLPSVGGAYIAKAFITVITGGAAVIAGTLSTAVLFGTVDQLVSFASTPVIGEIAMLVLALVLLRLMPQGVTGRFSETRHDWRGVRHRAHPLELVRGARCAARRATIGSRDEYADTAGYLGAIRAVACAHVGLRWDPQTSATQLILASALTPTPSPLSTSARAPCHSCSR